MRDIGAFVGASATDTSPRLPPGNHSYQPADPAAPPAGLPLAQIPEALLRQLNGLHSTLGYPKLGPG
jgi:hypothetical protein